MDPAKLGGSVCVQENAIPAIDVWLNDLKTDSRGSILLFFGAYDSYLIYCGILAIDQGQ
jgi:hypothetical protein